MKLRFATAAIAALAASAAIAAPAAWNGKYVFEEALGPNLTKTINLFVTHELTLSPTDCRIKAQGYQTDETILCTAAPKGQGLELRFKSYGDGKTVNKYGTKIYTVGEPLLTLSKPGGKLTTTWQSYTPNKKSPPGAYFKKA
ncbi:DUF5991 domain-containing protein [Sphingoaurantiacus capsulatus]|uniref:DUF5991 domain-containing protein n=1 Tax=Sphingoaurantiacus capsulatus TaxID=1771310 RepID=A0ABV7XAH8_9SPHN